jgi:hypothetical protein
MLYRYILAVCSQFLTKHINTLCGHKVGLLNVKPGGTVHEVSDWLEQCQEMYRSTKLRHRREIFIISSRNCLLIL